MAKEYSVVASFIAKTQGFVSGINSAKQSSETFVKNFNNAMESSQSSVDNLTNNLAEIKDRLNINGDVKDLGQDLKELGKNTNIDEMNDDLDRVEKNLKDVGKEAETQTGRVGGAFSGLKGKLGGLVGVIGAVFAVDKIVDFGKSIINTAAEIQALNSQYEQVMGDMKDSTDQYLGEMSSKWNKHPNELKSSYLQYVAILKSKGVEEGKAHELAKQYLDRTVDANAFSNESMEETTARFMGGIKGEYDSLDTAMVNLSATMLNDMSQKEYGKKFDELTVAQQETLKAQEMLRQHTSAGVFEQGSREANSYANNLAMVKNTWGELLEKYGSPLLEVANKGLSKLVGILENAPQAIDKAKEALSPFTDMIKGIIAAFSGNDDKASSILEKLGLSSSQVQMIINAVNLIQSYLSLMWNYWKTVFSGIKTAVVEVISFLAPYIMPIIQQVVSFIGEKLQLLTKFWNENGTMITQAVRNAFNLILSIIKFIMPAVLVVVDMVWNSIKGVINGALNIIMGFIKIFAGIFTGNWSKLWEGIKQALGGAVEFIWNFINLMFFGRILSMLKSFGTGALNVVKNAFTGMKDSAVNSVKNLYNGATGWFNNLLSKASGIVTDIKSVFQNFSLYEIGKNIIQGLINGIGSLASKVVNKAKEIASGIGDSVKNFFGIRSPSRLMMEYGGYIGEGLAVGLTNAQKLVGEAADGLANFSLPTKFVDSLHPSNTLNSISNGFNVPSQITNETNNTTQEFVVHNNLTFNISKKIDDFEIKQIANKVHGSTINIMKNKGWA